MSFRRETDLAKKQEAVNSLLKKLEEGILSYYESANYRSYLKTLSKFHEYSLNNTLLIAMQKPDATLVAGYTAWQKQFSRQVQKGETGIRILARLPIRKGWKWKRRNRTPARSS